MFSVVWSHTQGLRFKVPEEARGERRNRAETLKWGAWGNRRLWSSEADAACDDAVLHASHQSSCNSPHVDYSRAVVNTAATSWDSGWK